MLRGLIDYLGEGEYDTLYPPSFIEYDRSKSFEQLEIGDQTQLINDLSSDKVTGAEWVLKVGNDSYWGFLSREEGEKTPFNYSYQEWKNNLARWYNNSINGNQIKGFHFLTRTFNYYKLAQTIFDYRNKE
jgi:hypothetical protein